MKQLRLSTAHVTSFLAFINVTRLLAMNIMPRLFTINSCHNVYKCTRAFKQLRLFSTLQKYSGKIDNSYATTKRIEHGGY